MKPGRKPLPAATKKKRGTFQACRDGDKVQITVNGAPPLMPEEMTVEAQLIWADNIVRVMEAGCTEADSDLFANYCELNAALRASWNDETAAAPPTSALSELRKTAEMLGIAGPKSRVLRFGAPDKNKFARLRQR